MIESPVPQATAGFTFFPGLRGLARHPLIALIVRRIASLVFVAFFVLLAVFLMVQLVPGDPIYNSFGENVTPQQLVQLRADYHLNLPLYHQFWIYLTNAVQGDLSRSFQTNQGVTSIIRQRAGSSLQLAGTALGLVFLIGVPLGLVAGAFTREGRHRRVELLFTGTASLFGAIPDYLTGTLLVALFAVQFRLLPVAGSGSFKTLVLPALAVSLAPMLTLSRIVRVETLNVLAQDYIRTARSKRLKKHVIYVKHALPNVLTAALTIGGIIFANIVGGAVIVENVFNRNGLGTALVNAVVSKDYPVVQGLTLMLGIVVLAVNTLVDVTLGILDPRSLTKRR